MKIDTSLTARTGTLNNYELIEALKYPSLVNFSSRELQTEFHARFKNRLYRTCLRLCHRSRLNEDLAKDFFHDAIIKALQGINRFSIDKGLDLEHSTNTILKWLYRIVFNLFIDHLKKRIRFSDVEECNEESILDNSLIDEIDEIEIYPHQNNLEAILQNAWDNLTDNETLVIYYGIRYGCLQKRHMPENVLHDISEILNVKPDSVRQIKLRALKKFRDAFKL